MTRTPIQRAISLVLVGYEVACRTLTTEEREVLRDILAARLARDYLAEVGVLDDAFPPENEEAA